MPTILDLYERFKELDIDQVSVEAITETKDSIAAKNREQLYHGKNKKGESLHMYADKGYAVMKNAMNPVPGMGNPDLKLTGAFYEQIRTDVSGQSIITDSRDSKNVFLEKKYGSEIFGLSDPFKQEYVEDTLRPVFNRKITEATGLPFK